MDVGFSAIHEKMDIRFKEIKNEILEIKSDLEDLKLRMGIWFLDLKFKTLKKTKENRGKNWFKINNESTSIRKKNL